MMKSYNIKINLRIQRKIDEDRQKMFENIDSMKYKISKSDLDKIDDWSGYKDSFTNLIKLDKFNKKSLIKKNTINIYKKLDSVLNKSSTFIKNVNEETNKFFNKSNYNNLYLIYNNLFNLKIKNKKNTINLYKQTILNKKIIYININYKSPKTKISIFKHNKCLLTLTNGIFLKKIDIQKKKYIKSDRVTFLNLKTINNIVKNNFQNFKVVVNNIGCRNNINNFIKRVFNNTNNKDVCIINQYKISYDKYFKFKKIKSIKKKLKKKIIKYK